jgi:citrate synthase
VADDDRWMTSEAAAARLGVKPETLYAYVSRGAVRSERVPGTRRSRFLRADVERLAGRRRGGGRAGGLDVIVETDLTLLDPGGRLHYRGHDVAAAVDAGVPFEAVAGWLWSGDPEHRPFTTPAAMGAVAQRVGAALADQPVMDRLRAVVAAVRHTDPLRDDRRPAAVGTTARALIATMVDALPPADPDSAGDAEGGGSIAARLWPKVSPRPATAARVRLLDATLVLLADHELAASTLAARVAASTWADPYLVVLAGLAALGGPLHGGATVATRALLREVGEGAPAAEAIGRRLRDQQLIPGFGHRVYEERDPRAEILLGLLAAEERRPAEEALVATMHERGLPFPNVDFAIAALAERHRMIDEAGEVVFAVARTAGWLGHAAEEYGHRLRFRGRGVYTGPPPGPSPSWPAAPPP